MPATSLGIDDLISLRRPQAAVLSPDGSQIACVTSSVDWNTNQFVTRLSLLDARTGGERALASIGRTNTGAAWTADGPLPSESEMNPSGCALQDLGVASRRVFFRGAGHVLPTPRMLRAAMQPNYDWFNHYIFGDPLPASGTGAW